jgi:1-acyl-sn-glycerol-3-phosphate acyltransferase
MWMMHYLGLCRYKVKGRENIANDKSCLVVANHPSLVDVVALIGLYPNACCIIKKQVWDNPFMHRVVKAAGYIPNDEPQYLLENCAASIARGDVIIIFPEGTRTVPGQEMNLQRGAAHIALRLNCPIRTVQIEVNPTTLTKNLPWYVIPDRRSDFNLCIGDKIFIEDTIQTDLPPSLASRKLTKKIRESIDTSYTQMH